MSRRRGGAAARRLHLAPGVIAIIVVFLLSRLLYAIAGVGYDIRTLEMFDQILDPELLRHDLFESLYYLHSQPPLFNLYLGLVLKAAGEHYALVFQMLSRALGLAGGILIYRLMLRLEVREWVALALTLLFIVSPSYLVIENQLFYDLPLMVLFAGSALLFHRVLADGRGRDLLLFFGLLAVAGLMRSVIHPLFLVFALALLIALRPNEWRKHIAIVTVPIMLLLALYVKNEIVFGEFTASTWLGGNLACMTCNQMTPMERQALIDRGIMNRFAMIDDPFSPLDTFRRAGLVMPARTGVAALDREIKSTGAPNNNHVAYIGIERAYMNNVRAVFSESPQTYAASVAKAYVIYCMPQSKVWCYQENREAIRGVDLWYNHLIYGQIRYELPAPEEYGEERSNKLIAMFLNTGFVLLLGLPLLLLATIRRLRRAPTGVRDPSNGTTIYMTSVCVTITVAGILLSVGENCRFRFPIDPFLLTLLGMQIEIWLRRRSERYSIVQGI